MNYMRKTEIYVFNWKKLKIKWSTKDWFVKNSFYICIIIMNFKIQLAMRTIVETNNNLTKGIFLREFMKRDTSESEVIETYLASENLLAKDWLTPEENEAWKNL
ncbi:hypothetical protein FACS189440_01070 [Bacteroidia bacterium]|nr:hypothetical protein FACS189423_09330 [Bacteroidia bacterium]GHT45313.1 hypothetical protein FACS189440_01070 [Bacteroidia bacterium]